jgi:hypothetical protein
LGATERLTPSDSEIERGRLVARDSESAILGAGDLLHQIDDRASKLWVWNLHEGFGEVEPVRRGEIVRYEFRKRSVDLRTLLAGDVRGSFEEERRGHLQYL